MFLVCFALAQDVPSQRTTLVYAGVGGTLIAGGNGSGFGAGFAQQLGVDFSMSRIAWISLEFDHSHHPLVDGAGYFVDGGTSTESMVGGRDYLVADGGVKVDVLLPRESPGAVRAVPHVRFGAGAAGTDTQLDVPSFQGRQEIRSRALAPLLSFGAGVNVYLGEWLLVSPRLKVQGLLARDDGEIDKQTSVGIEVRGQGVVDVGVLF